MSKKTCKNGHPIGVKNTSGGQCTPLYCAYEKPKKSPEQIKEALLNQHIEVPLDMLNFPPGYKIPRTNKEKVGDAVEAANTHMQVLLAAEEARHSALGLTDAQRNAKGAEAELVTRQLLEDAAALAAAELVHAVRYGNDKVRLEAARDLLDRTGHGKKEGPQVGNAPMLVINFSNELPWGRKDVAVAERVITKAAQNGTLLEETSKAKGPYAAEGVIDSEADTDA